MAAAKGGAVQISEPRIEEHSAMVVAGVSQVFPLDGDFSSLWDELNQKASPAMLDVLNVTQYLGVCTQPNPKGQVRYTAGFLVSEPASAAKLGLGVLELPASTYAVGGDRPDFGVHSGWLCELRGGVLREESAVPPGGWP